MFRRHYDKIIALVALVLLLASLVSIGLNTGGRQGREQQFEEEIAREPVHKQPLTLGYESYSQAVTRVESPLLLSTWPKAALFVPESRVACVHVNCGKPIPEGATNCLFCGFAQLKKERPGNDTDGGGIPDGDEKRLGLDPYDSEDEKRDNDNDSFTNVEEWRVGTDIDDPTSHPPKVVKLIVKDVKVIPFELIFKSVTGKGERRQFWFNDTRSRVSPFGRMNEPLKNASDIVVIAYDPEAKKDPIAGMPNQFRTLGSVTVRRGNKELTLIQGERTPEKDPIVTLAFPHTGETFKDLSTGAEFELDGKGYRVIDVDITTESVVLRSLIDKSEITVK